MLNCRNPAVGTITLNMDRLETWKNPIFVPAKLGDENELPKTIPNSTGIIMNPKFEIIQVKTDAIINTLNHIMTFEDLGGTATKTPVSKSLSMMPPNSQGRG